MVDDQVPDHRAVRSEKVELPIDDVSNYIGYIPIGCVGLNQEWLVVDIESNRCIVHFLLCSCLCLHWSVYQLDWIVVVLGFSSLFVCLFVLLQHTFEHRISLLRKWDWHEAGQERREKEGQARWDSQTLIPPYRNRAKQERSNDDEERLEKKERKS